MDSIEIKEYAKEKIKGHLGDYWKGMILICLVEIIINVLSTKLFGFNDVKSNISSLIASILLAPASIGLFKYVDELLKGNKPDVKTIFSYYSNFLNIAVMTAISTILVLIGFILLIIPGFYLMLSYAVAPYLMMKDKNIDPIDVLKKSRKLMKGHCFDLLIFVLSFIGWFLLVVITFGIAIIWVGPYIQVSIQKYYEKITA